MNFNWFFNIFSPRSKYFTGLLPDIRLESEKRLDYLHEERLAGAAVGDPFGNQQVVQSSYFYENQHNTSSCVPHGVGLALAIERKADQGTYTRISQMFPYRLRSNYPGEGCVFQNIFDVLRHQGSPLWTTLPTPFSEIQANSIQLTQAEYNEASIFKGLNYFTLGSKFNDITTLATIAQQGHGVSILIYAQQDEWGRDFPIIETTNIKPYNAEVSHCVCILPNSGFMLNGIKYVTVQDSAHFGGKTLRYLSEDWIRQRVFAAGYWDTVATVGGGPVPRYKFNSNLTYGMHSEDVRQMQLLFIAQNLLPNDCATGSFFGLTLAALHTFQDKYASEILIPSGLTKPTDVFGPASRGVANRICA